ncbi:Nitrous oxide reductase [Flavobacterium longum]|uniref:nitrous oxide reductase accessory protein NosL n=1 Tax=Flavobacterium longum TaxID=1299340 RepID=UPI0039ED570A
MKIFLTLLTTCFLMSCGAKEPKPIKLNADDCDFCKMTISNGKFAAQLITQKGRHYKFDDIACMIQFAKSNTVVPYEAFFVNDYLKDNSFIPVEKSFLLKGGTINSPMRGNCAAFATANEQKEFQTQLHAEAMTWEQVYNSY